MSGKASRGDRRPLTMAGEDEAHLQGQMLAQAVAQRRERRLRREDTDPATGATGTGITPSTSTGSGSGSNSNSVSSGERERASPAATATATVTATATPLGQRHLVPSSTPTEINHQDEIERIREMRARRLRKERAEAAQQQLQETSPAASPPTNTSTTSSASVSVTASASTSNSTARTSTETPDGTILATLERRAERQHQRQARPTTNVPSRTKSTPVSSRRELEEAGLIRRERRPLDGPINPHSQRDDDASASSSTYSRSRRERIDRLASATDDDALSAYSRARRERLQTTTDQDSLLLRSHSHSRLRKDRERGVLPTDQDSEATGTYVRTRSRRTFSKDSASDDNNEDDHAKMTDEDATSAYSRSSERLTARLKLASNRKLEPSEQDAGSQHSKEDRRQLLSRSNSGGEDLSLLATNRAGQQRRPPARAKSADQDLLAMDLRRRNDDETKAPRNTHTDTKRDAQTTGATTRTPSTDLTARLRERREARAAEKEIKHDQDPLADRLGMEVERRLARRRSNEGLYQLSAASTIASNTPISTSMSLRNINSKGDASATAHLEIDTLLADAHENSHALSIKVQIVSAIDLPLNVVANMPLCPVVKIGFARIPHHADEARLLLQDTFRTKSIATIQSSLLRSTTTKIMGKRDNGTIDFNQEMRWDGLTHPTKIALVVEIAARAVRTPTNYNESPPAMQPDHTPKSPQPTKRIHSIVAASTSIPKPALEALEPKDKPDPVRNLQRNSSGSEEDLGGGFRALWRKATSRKAAELEAAEAAAAVARMLVEQDNPTSTNALPVEEKIQDTGLHQFAAISRGSVLPNAEIDVSLRQRQKGSERCPMTEDARLGTLVIPLAQLPLEKVLENAGSAKLEKWFQLGEAFEADFGLQRMKQPSVRLDITCSHAQTMNQAEDNIDFKSITHNTTEANKTSNPVIPQRALEESKDDTDDSSSPNKTTNAIDPLLEPGVLDFIAIVGCKDTGKHNTTDNGVNGWVESSPECTLLEQFPPNNEFHARNGRKALLPEMVQWFCFPEGARLWRGTAPPSHSDLNLKRFSASSPPNVASSIAAFDACLNCTTSFSWFVIASNSDEYGSKLVKTYGAVIRFFSPAPIGADSTRQGSKRLWVPMGICLTSNLPIIGVMEAMLLRLCEDLSSRVSLESRELTKLDKLHEILAKIIVKYQKPIAGAVNCSVPFIDGERFLLSLPPPTGLPPLPHGKAIVSACRLLGAEGLNFILSAVLTESKILIHSHDMADIVMVAEVVTALIYPFSWSLPYIPILPVGMLEFVEAPLSYILGVPSHNFKLIDRNALEDVVVIDLDNCFSTPSFLENKRSLKAGTHRNPPPLPSQVAANLSRAVYKLLRAEEEIDAELGLSSFGDQSLPRLEAESLAEREFRVSVAIEICGLLRGYQECTGPVFNRDKFLKTAPALFEDRKDQKGVIRPSTQGKVISPRSKRFLSVLVNTQNFQQFLESVDSGEVAFFHEVMEIVEDPDKVPTRSGDTHAIRSEKSLAHLVKNLQKAEDNVSTFQVDKEKDSGEIFYDHDDSCFDDDCEQLLAGDFIDDTDVLPCSDPDLTVSFTEALLRPSGSSQGNDPESARWQYREILNITEGCAELVTSEVERIRLSKAIGERRYRDWKAAQDQRERAEMGIKFTRQSIVAATKEGAALDLTTLISSVSNGEETDNVLVQPRPHIQRRTASNPEQQRIVDAKDRDIIRRCLDRAHGENTSSNPFIENGRDLLAESEKALRNPSAQGFLLSILSQRSRMETQRLRLKRGQLASQQASVSRLDPVAFTCLVRLSCAILDSCMEYQEFETAYRLLTLAAGFIMWSENKCYETSIDKDTAGQQVVTMTSSIGLHPIFANLSLWETVMKMHLTDRRSGKKSETRPSDIIAGEETDEEDDEMEYEAATATLFDMKGYDVPGEELSRFAMRVSEKKGWFSDDRGRQLLVLARRITLRRDMAGESTPLATDSSIEMMARSQNIPIALVRNVDWENKKTTEDAAWKEISWCHPAAPTSQGVGRLSDSGLQNLDVKYMKRSPITALASFGHSVVVTGGLDGSIFLAYSIIGSESIGIRGIHLDWGSASRAGGGFSSDGEYGVGAVSCIAAAFGGAQQHVNTTPFETKRELSSDEVTDVIRTMDGSRVVAGTTAGDLRVWSVNDVLSSLLASKSDDDADGNTKSAFTRLKFSLRGRALAGHRGGVTAIDVPSQIYRPDSLVTGGADGLIKLWSLRSPATGRRPNTSAMTLEQDTASQQRGRGGDALSVLSGHNGRISFVKTAWHGDRLLSGGADQDLRIWDLASGGKCSHVLSGHSSWVTQIDSWGSNTIVSGSADRTLSLWDPRVSSTPLFVLRYHKAPITDMLVGSRTDPLMVSAASDGTIATWDFRVLSQSPDESKITLQGRKSKSIREPKLSVVHSGEPTKRLTAGQVLLCRSILNPETSVLSIGPDAVVREWDKIGTGTLENEMTTNHCDAISGFLPCRTGTLHDQTDYRSDGILTSSLDGTVRMRRLESKQSE